MSYYSVDLVSLHLLFLLNLYFQVIFFMAFDSHLFQNGFQNLNICMLQKSWIGKPLLRNTKHVNLPPLSAYASFIRDGESAYFLFPISKHLSFQACVWHGGNSIFFQRCKSLNVSTYCGEEMTLTIMIISLLILQETEAVRSI